MLLADGEVKDRIMEWIASVAAFSGVEVWAFCIMDNHLHLFVHVPPVPERLWLDPDDEPAAYAFGMRPPECRELPRRRRNVAGKDRLPLSWAVASLSRRVNPFPEVDCPPEPRSVVT